MENDKKPSKAFSEKVKASIDLVSLIGKSVSLHKEGNEWYMGATSASSVSGKSLKVNCREQYFVNFAETDCKGDAFNWIAYDRNLDITKDFLEILRIAAEEAGIPFEGVTDKDIAESAEAHKVHDALTQAAEIYHTNLTPELRAYAKGKWGITDDTIDSLKIGYAKPGNGSNLIGVIDDDTLLKTGLVNIVYANDDTNTAVEIFQGRIVFPYWNGGKVVNFAARGSEKDKEGKVKNPEEQELLKTPNTPYEGAKYKKLLVHSEKRPYVNKSINNRYLFGEDSIRKQDYCIITEGIADAIMLMQNGIPVLSPVTVQFAENDHDKLVHAARRLKTVYICNDNELSGAGEHGAIKTALLLKNEGVDVKIILLPKENLSKMDVAEYFLRHTKEEFEKVKDQSKDILVHLLNKVQPSTCADATIAKTENFKKAIEFTETVLKNVTNEDEVNLFIRNNIKNYFNKFTTEDIRSIAKAYKNTVAENNSKNPDQEHKMVFDLDSESGRSTMIQVLAREIMQEKHMKYVAGMLRIYDNGVYPDDQTAITRLKRDILIMAGKEHKTPIVEKHANNVVKVLEILNSVGETEHNYDPDDLAVGNGILNLKTFELQEFTPDKVFFNKIPINYDPTAPEPELFLDLMDKVFKGNEEQRVLMQEIFGFCLLNNYKYQSIIYLLGDGGNGKGTVIKILTYLLGNEATSSATLNQLTDHNNVDYYLAKLHGKRANICGDIGAKKIENTENIKKLSSNTDKISARLPYGVPFDFINNAKLIFALNKMPKKDAFTTGDKRRDVIISFNNPISDTKYDIKGFAELIRDSGEMSGVLNWALEGLKRLERNQRFTDKRTVAQKGLEYDMKSNPMKYFVDDCIDQDPLGGVIPNVTVYEAYNKYRKIHGMPELSEQEIKNGLKYWCGQIGITVTEKRERMKKLCGFVTPEIKSILGDSKQVRVFTGIKLMENEEEDAKGLNTFANATHTEEKTSVLDDFKNALCD